MPAMGIILTFLTIWSIPVRFKHFFFAILIVAILTACGGKTTEIAGPTVAPSGTPLPPPTMIPTLSTPLALLVVPVEMDKVSSDLYQKTVYDLSQQSGFRFQVRNTLTAADVADPTLKVVIVLPPDPGIASFAPAAPGVQFLAVNISGLTAGANVSVLAGDSQVDIPAFLAGYTAAMISDEYHIGMIIPQGDADAQRAFLAFKNGMTYYCGLCRTFYISPFGYPQYIEIPANEDTTRFGGYANVLINDKKVYTLYVYPSLANADFLSYVDRDLHARTAPRWLGDDYSPGHCQGDTNRLAEFGRGAGRHQRSIPARACGCGPGLALRWKTPPRPGNFGCVAGWSNFNCKSIIILNP